MRAFPVLASALATLLALPASAASTDAWLGGDKTLHFGISAGIAAGGYGGAALFSDDTRVRLGLGSALALSVGMGKELWDFTGRGDPSWKDLTWDVAGTVAGLAIAWAIDRFLFTCPSHRAIGRDPSLDLGESPFVFRPTRREIVAQ